MNHDPYAESVAVAVTGIAGPGGGSVEKPVGLVCFAVAGARGTEVRTSRFTGDRAVMQGSAKLDRRS